MLEDKITLKNNQKDCATNKCATQKRSKKIMEDKYFEGGKQIDLTKKRTPLPADKSKTAKKGDGGVKQQSITKMKKPKK
tara:strand:- start:40 stop:276 length:237 start_codon:yes stop_codon:yes gene_type:complete